MCPFWCTVGGTKTTQHLTRRNPNLVPDRDIATLLSEAEAGLKKTATHVPNVFSAGLRTTLEPGVACTFATSSCRGICGHFDFHAA